MRNPDNPADRITVTAALPLVQAVYARHPAGCCAHVVIDDGNCLQVFADESLVGAREAQHVECVALCEALAAMTITQRRKLYAMHARHPA